MFLTNSHALNSILGDGMDTFNYLLAQDGIDVNIRNNNGWVALRYAAKLLGHGADKPLVNE